VDKLRQGPAATAMQEEEEACGQGWQGQAPAGASSSSNAGIAAVGTIASISTSCNKTAAADVMTALVIW